MPIIRETGVVEKRKVETLYLPLRIILSAPISKEDKGLFDGHGTIVIQSKGQNVVTGEIVELSGKDQTITDYIDELLKINIKYAEDESGVCQKTMAGTELVSAIRGLINMVYRGEIPKPEVLNDD
jgi:hypothetical protein